MVKTKETGKSAFAKRLAEIKGNWEKARNAENSAFGASLPEGNYICSIEKVELGESSKGRLQCAWVLVVLTGEFAGSKIRSYDGLETESNLEFFARKLATFGYDPRETDITGLEDVLAEIAKDDPQIRVRVKESGEFTNVYFQNTLSAAQRIETEEPEETEKPKKGKSKAPKEAEETEEEEEEEEEAPKKPSKKVKEEPEEEAEEEETQAPKKRGRPAGTKNKVKEEPKEEPDEAEEEEEGEVAIGSKVRILVDGKKIVATVRKIDEENSQLLVKIGDNPMLKRVKAEECVLI